MLTNRSSRPAFAAFALFVFSIFLPGFTKPEIQKTAETETGLPDLRFTGLVGVERLGNRTFAYTFEIINGGTLPADLSRMRVRTELSVTANINYSVLRTDRYVNMRYDTPPNPTVLNPGQRTIVKMKTSTSVDLPQVNERPFYVRVTLDVNNSVEELSELNNSAQGNDWGLN